MSHMLINSQTGEHIAESEKILEGFAIKNTQTGAVEVRYHGDVYVNRGGAKRAAREKNRYHSDNRYVVAEVKIIPTGVEHHLDKESEKWREVK